VLASTEQATGYFGVLRRILTSRWFALVPLVFLLHLTFGGYQLRKGPVTAEIGVIDVNLNQNTIVDATDRDAIIKATIRPANLRYFVQQPQWLSSHVMGQSWGDVTQLNGAINFAINSLDLAKRDSKTLKVYFDVSQEVKEAILSALQADTSFKSNIEFINCPDCASSADLVMIALCKDGIEPCFGSIRHDTPGPSASNWLNSKPDWKKLGTTTRLTTSDPPCWNRREFLYEFAPLADTAQEASELAVGLTIGAPSTTNYPQQREHFFKASRPRNVGHQSALLFAETWFPSPRCHPRMRYQGEKPIMSSFYSLAIPSRTKGAIGLGSVCVISGHQQRVGDHARLAARCIQKWLDPMISLTERGPPPGQQNFDRLPD
jgi:hypothetical protein